MTERFYPREENLGQECQYWALGRKLMCCYPKAELEGRISCEGLIDDVCLFVKDGRKPGSLTQEQVYEILTRMPPYGPYLPPGDTK